LQNFVSPLIKKLLGNGSDEWSSNPETILGRFRCWQTLRPEDEKKKFLKTFFFSLSLLLRFFGKLERERQRDREREKLCIPRENVFYVGRQLCQKTLTTCTVEKSIGTVFSSKNDDVVNDSH
jgi:hypothetical protein